MQLTVERIHLFVARNDRAGFFRFPADEGVERMVQHFERHLRHARDVDVRFELRLLAQLDGPAGNGGGFVADPFQIMRDLHSHGNQPQIAGQRRFGEEPDRQIVHFDFQLINGIVFFLHAPGEVIVAIHQRLDGFVDGGFGLAGHGQQFLFQRGEFLIEVLHNFPNQPNRPVT